MRFWTQKIYIDIETGEIIPENIFYEKYYEIKRVKRTEVNQVKGIDYAKIEIEVHCKQTYQTKLDIDELVTLRM